MAVPTGSKIGVDFTSTSSTALFTLLDRTSGTGDVLAVYVKADSSITAGDVVAITSTGTASRATPTLTINTSNVELGVSPVAFAADEYGWVYRNGLGITVNCSATCSASAALYLATTSGRVSDVAGSATLVGFQIATVSTTASLTPTTGSISWPKVNFAGK